MSYSSSSTKRRFLFLAVIVTLAGIGWSFFWSYAAGRIDDFVVVKMAAGQGGVAVSCPGREISGWPFRMEMRCDALDLTSASGGTFALSALRAVALIYDPRHLIVEADGPLRAETGDGGPTLSAMWASARASLRARNHRLAAAALSVQGMDVSLADLFHNPGNAQDQRIEAERAEFHVRENPGMPGAADIALTLDALSLSGLFQTAAPLDAGVLFYVPRAVELLQGHPDRFAAELIRDARPIDVSEARLVQGDASMTARGSLTLDPSGYLNGELDVTVVEPDKMAQLLAPLYPRDSTVPAAFQGVLIGFGARTVVDGHPVIKARLRLVSGQVRIGLVPVAQIPAIF